MTSTPLPPGPPPRPGERAAVDDLARYAERIDVRSPGEFAEDRIPGAVNWFYAEASEPPST